MKSGAKLVKNLKPQLDKRIKALTGKAVYAGVPANKTYRKEDPVTNATIAYVQDQGSPAHNIPARPFMRPGIKRAQPSIRQQLKAAGLDILSGGKEDANKAFNRAGLAAQNAIRGVIREGIPPPLKPGTIKNRRRGRQTASKRSGELWYERHLKEGISPILAQQIEGIVPLINTGQLLNSISYVVREKK